MKKGNPILSEREYKDKLHSLYAHSFDYEKWCKEWEQVRQELKTLCTDKPDKMVITISGARYKGAKNFE